LPRIPHNIDLAEVLERLDRVELAVSALGVKTSSVLDAIKALTPTPASRVHHAVATPPRVVAACALGDVTSNSEELNAPLHHPQDCVKLPEIPPWPVLVTSTAAQAVDNDGAMLQISAMPEFATVEALELSQTDMLKLANTWSASDVRPLLEPIARKASVDGSSHDTFDHRDASSAAVSAGTCYAGVVSSAAQVPTIRGGVVLGSSAPASPTRGGHVCSLATVFSADCSEDDDVSSEGGSDEVMDWHADDVVVSAVQVASFDSDVIIRDFPMKIHATYTLDEVRRAISRASGFFIKLLEVRLAVLSDVGPVLLPDASDSARVADMYPGSTLHDGDIVLVFTVALPGDGNTRPPR